MVKSTELRLLFLGLTAALAFDSICFGSRNGNLEYWQTTGISHDIDKDWTVHGEEEFRAGRHNGNPYLHNVNVGFVYKGLAESVDIGLDFKKEYEKDSTGKFRQENRPHLNLIFSSTLLDIDASNRLRLEYRNREKKEDLFRLRNCTTLKFPVKVTKLHLQPFVSEEFFINLGEDNVSQNRLSLGFSGAPARNLKASIYYMWRTNKITGGWENTNVIGVGLGFRF